MRRKLVRVAMAAALLTPLTWMGVYAHPIPLQVRLHTAAKPTIRKRHGSSAGVTASVVQAALTRLDAQANQFTSAVQSLAQAESTTQSVYQNIQPILQPLAGVAQQLQSAKSPKQALQILES